MFLFTITNTLGQQHFQVIKRKLEENLYIIHAYTHVHEQHIEQLLKTNTDTQIEMQEIQKHALCLSSIERVKLNFRLQQLKLPQAKLSGRSALFLPAAQSQPLHCLLLCASTGFHTPT